MYRDQHFRNCSSGCCHLKASAVVLAFIFFLLIFTAGFSAGNINAQSDLAAQIEPEILKTGYKLNNKTGSVIFQIDTKLTNHSEIGIMDVIYKLTFFDKKGNEMGTAHGYFNGQDTPMKPGESVINNRSGQFYADQEPESVQVEVTEVKTEEEMPPVYLPRTGDYLYRALSDRNLENIREDPPVLIKMWIDHGGPRDEGEYSEPETITRFVDAFLQIRIAAETDISVTDNYNGFAMSFANGEFYVVRLNLTNLEYNVYGTEHIYELDNFGPFWGLMNDLTDPVDEETERGGS